MNQMKKFVFPDSSVFLHFSPLNKIDLPGFLGSAEVEVVLAFVVMEELVRHQWDHPELEVRRRAKETLKLIGNWLEGRNAIGPRVTTSFIGKQPDSKTMERYQLNWQHQNDVLLGVLLEYKKAPPDKAVILLVGDKGLAERATSLAIEVAALPDQHTVAHPEGKQIVHQELAHFRYRIPDLSLSFVKGKDKIAIKIAPQLDSLTTTMQAQLVAVANKMRRRAAQQQADNELEASLDDLDTMAAIIKQVLPSGSRYFLSGIAEDDVERYGREVEAYPEKFERYLHRCLETINVHRRTIRLALELRNAGGASAENVVLLLTLPEQLEWHWQQSDSDMPAPPTPPTLPELKGQAAERSFHIGGVSSVPPELLDKDNISGEAATGASPMISEGGTQLKWELGTYRHHQSRLLAPLYVGFRSADDVSDFAILWEIWDKKSQGPVRGQLMVSINTVMSAG